MGNGAAAGPVAMLYPKVTDVSVSICLLNKLKGKQVRSDHLELDLGGLPVISA